jgi:hypothetical protein
MRDSHSSKYENVWLSKKPCNLAKFDDFFGKTIASICRFEEWVKSSSLLSVCFILSSRFHPEDGRDMFP